MNWRAAAFTYCEIAARRRAGRRAASRRCAPRTASRCSRRRARLARSSDRPIGALDRDVDDREIRDGLALAVLEDLEVVPGEVADEASLAVGDEHVHVDVVNCTLKVASVAARTVASGRR